MERKTSESVYLETYEVVKHVGGSVHVCSAEWHALASLEGRETCLFATERVVRFGRSAIVGLSELRTGALVGQEGCYQLKAVGIHCNLFEYLPFCH